MGEELHPSEVMGHSEADVAEVEALAADSAVSEVADPAKQKLDDHLENLITGRGFESECQIDDRYSQRGSKGKRGAVIIREGVIAESTGKPDEVYQLHKKSTDPHMQYENANNCHFCTR